MTENALSVNLTNMGVDSLICLFGAHMVKRKIETYLQQTAENFKVITITGPRQAGKTTLAKAAFPAHLYYDMDNPLYQIRFQTYPESLFMPRDGKIIFDEYQNIPTVTHFIKVYADEQNQTGQYILTGRNQFEYMQNVTQSLAGRTALMKLFPFSWEEMYAQSNDRMFDCIQRGWYPALLHQGLDTETFYTSYIGTYLERDIRNLALVKDLAQFRLFLGLCAGRTGAELNKSSLASAAGIDVKTVTQWLSLLETSFVITFLPPFQKNWSKRLTKTPKLYFLDTGLVCSLLGIRDGHTLSNHPLRGEIFETFVVGEVIKHFANHGQHPNLYYLRERNGLEIDLVIERNARLFPVQIKSGQTFNASWLDSFKLLNTRSSAFSSPMIVYAGVEEFGISNTRVVSAPRLSSTLSTLI